MQVFSFPFLLRPSRSEYFKNAYVRPVLHRFAAAASLPFHAMLGPRCPDTLGILMYHRVVGRTARLRMPTWNVEPHPFRHQLEGLLTRGHQFWPMRQVLRSCREGQPIPPKVVVVTFDDGFECVFTEAWPILKDLRIPATVFLATGYLDGENAVPFDDWPAAGSPQSPPAAWRLMSRKQCDELLTHGLVELGCHTHWHEDYTQRPDAFEADLAQSQACLRDWFGLEDCTFAFPFGRHTPRMVEIARSSGLLCALTDQRRLVEPDSDPFTWGRFAAEPNDTPSTLAAKLSGWYTPFRDAWLHLGR